MLLVFLLLASVVFIVVATTKLGLHPFLALLLAAFGFGLLSGMPPSEVVKSINQGGAAREGVKVTSWGRPGRRTGGGGYTGGRPQHGGCRPVCPGRAGGLPGGL